MPVVKSFSVGSGDMFYISHGVDSFTLIDCNLGTENEKAILDECAKINASKGINRFICTHPDQDHFGGIEVLNERIPINNFYCIKNNAKKTVDTLSFKTYRDLRDSNKACFVRKGLSRKWLNDSDDSRGGAGLQFLWPDLKNEHYIKALEACDSGTSFNNVSCVLRYRVADGASFMWLGDLHTQFMEDIFPSITLEKTTVVFASHHGRESGKIPNSWLEVLDPQIIVIGEAPSRHLHYYTGYKTITQNSAGDVTMHCVGNKVHFYSSNSSYYHNGLTNEYQTTYDNYVGSIKVETEYTL